MPDAETSVNWTMVGICAHQSALEGRREDRHPAVLIGRPHATLSLHTEGQDRT